MVWIENARELFTKAARKDISPSELARELRPILAEADGYLPELADELREFLSLDLSDYAYSLAIHDQPAIDGLNESISAWAQRLGQHNS